MQRRQVLKRPFRRRRGDLVPFLDGQMSDEQRFELRRGFEEMVEGGRGKIGRGEPDRS